MAQAERTIDSRLLRCLVAVAAIGVCTAPGCNPIQFEWQGPSDGFRGADLNSDGAIDQEEREWIYGAYRDQLSYFRSYDCDQDGRITWHEHFQHRFKGRSCQGSSAHEPSVMPEIHRVSPRLTSANDVVVRTPVALHIDRAPRSRPPRREHPYSDSDVRSDQAEKVKVGTGPLERVDLLPSKYQYSRPHPQMPESIQRLRCVVSNPTRDFRITLVDLDIEWNLVGDPSTPMRRGYLKTASIEPGGSAAFLAWFPTEVRQARCLLRGVLGQPAR